MLSLGCILISDLIVANLLMYSLPGMIKTHGSELRGQEEAACMSSGLRDHYSELFTWMAGQEEAACMHVFWPTRPLQ